MSNALRHVLTVSKADLLKKEAKVKMANDKKRERSLTETPIDCSKRHELARIVADATVELTKTKAGSTEWKAASASLRTARSAYWEHVREHKCKDPRERLKAIGVPKA